MLRHGWPRHRCRVQPALVIHRRLARCRHIPQGLHVDCPFGGVRNALGEILDGNPIHGLDTDIAFRAELREGVRKRLGHGYLGLRVGSCTGMSVSCHRSSASFQESAWPSSTDSVSAHVSVANAGTRNTPGSKGLSSASVAPT